jgi:LacI family transcriptional regulator
MGHILISMSRSPVVALAFQLGLPYLRLILEGILAYARQLGNWRFVLSPETQYLNLDSLTGWDGDGVLAVVETLKQRQAAQRLRCPVVNLTGTLRDTGLPTVRNDNVLIGRLAADHLLERGFRRFAYYGPEAILYSEERCRSFTERVAAAGCSCEAFIAPSSLRPNRPWVWNRTELADWLRGLRCPVGLFAANDERARLALEATLSIGRPVPEDVAILGVDDDPVACLLATPHLTSVAPDSERIGSEGAALLDRLMSGRRPPQQPLLIPPRGLVARASTDIMTADDPALRRVLAEIRSRHDQEFSVKQILHHVGISRSTLERLFRRHLQCSPHEFIARVRVAKARELLAVKPPLRLKEIAHQCGFHDTRRLKLVFQNITGLSPRACRSQFAS